MIRAAKTGASIVLAGSHAAPELWPEYIRSFEGCTKISPNSIAPLIPFLLFGVGGNPGLTA
jgi:hypothetical protein